MKKNLLVKTTLNTEGNPLKYNSLCVQNSVVNPQSGRWGDINSNILTSFSCQQQFNLLSTFRQHNMSHMGFIFAPVNNHILCIYRTITLAFRRGVTTVFSHSVNVTSPHERRLEFIM